MVAPPRRKRTQTRPHRPPPGTRGCALPRGRCQRPELLGMVRAKHREQHNSRAITVLVVVSINDPETMANSSRFLPELLTESKRKNALGFVFWDTVLGVLGHCVPRARWRLRRQLHRDAWTTDNTRCLGCSCWVRSSLRRLSESNTTRASRSSVF